MDVVEIGRHWHQELDRIVSESGMERWRIEEAFAYGGCAVLALEMASHRGLGLCVVGEPGSFAHAFCDLGNGYGMDIWGVRSFQEILAMWKDDDISYKIRRVTEEELVSMGVGQVEAAFSRLAKEIAQDACIAGAAYDDFTRTEFNCGACGDFASALHDLTGWSIMAEFSGVDDIEHIWVVNDEGRAVDVNGIHDDGVAITPYSIPNRNRVLPIERHEAVSDDDYSLRNRYWAHALIKRFPELFGVQDFQVTP